MKSIAIIDDESDARQVLRTMLEIYCPDIEICGEANSVESAYLLIRKMQPQTILLDISMEDGSGFDLLDRFPNRSFKVIFTTAHDEFAIKAFRYHALDYLLKPINPIELTQAIDLLKQDNSNDYQTKINQLLESNKKQKIDKITLTSQEGLIFLNLDEIVRLESDGSYTTFYLINKEKHLISRPLKYFEDLFLDRNFFKIHQSHLVNIAFIKKILREDGGFAVMDDGFKVAIARRRKDEFLEVMKNRFL